MLEKKRGWLSRHIRVIVVAVAATMAGCAERDGLLSTAPNALRDPLDATSATERRMTPTEVDKFLDRGRPSISSVVLDAKRRGLMPNDEMVASASASQDLESLVTAGGTADGLTAVNVSYSSMPHLAAWASRTSVMTGFARRVFLSTTGRYNKLNHGIKTFSDVCGDGPAEGYLQVCNRGTTYVDLDCYPEANGIWASSQHAVTWRFVSTQMAPTSDFATCQLPRRVNSVGIVGGNSVYVGEALSLSAVATDNLGASAADLCPAFTWSSSSAGVASVGSGGGVTGVSAGQATISAACSGVTGSLAVTSSVRCAGGATNRTPNRADGRRSDAIYASMMDPCDNPCDDPLTPGVETCGGSGGGDPVQTGQFYGWEFPSTNLTCEKWKWTVTIGGYVSEIYYTLENCYDPM